MSGLADRTLEGLRRTEVRATALAVLTTNLGLAVAFETPVYLVGALPPLLLPMARARGLQGSPAIEVAAGLLGVAAGLPVGLARGEAAPGLAMFLLVAQALKLLFPRAPRDEGVALAVAVALLGVAASEAVHPAFGLLMLLAAGSTLLALSARSAASSLRGVRGALAAPPGVGPGPPDLRPARLRPLLLPLVAMLGVAATAFVLFPRVGAHLLPSERDARERLAGFTDVVGLDDLGRIQQSEAIAFRAELVAGTLPAAPYWRGRVLDSIDGERWTWQASRTFGYAGSRLDGAQLSFHDRLLREPSGAPRLEVAIYQEPLGTRCLFTVGAVSRVTFRAARPELIDRDAMGAILAHRPASVPMAYRLEGWSVEVPQYLQTREMTRRIELACLQLPATLDQERLRRWARDQLARRRLDPDRDEAARICAALEDVLATSFEYTLDAERTPGIPPVEDFLFTRRKGHCEYFASAMVVLLRLLGIPARLVSGFHGGELDGWSRTWIVRQKNAHAWVEARTQEGWRRYDPTPAVAGAGAGEFDLVQAARTAWEAFELRWLKHVVAYDAYDQKLALDDARLRLAQVLAQVLLFVDGMGGLGRPIAALMTLVGLAAATLAARRLLGGPTRLRARTLDPQAQRVVAALARRGVAREPHETLREVALRARPNIGPASEAVERFVAAHDARRWGGQAVADEPALAEAAVKALSG